MKYYLQVNSEDGRLYYDGMGFSPIFSEAKLFESLEEVEAVCDYLKPKVRKWGFLRIFELDN